MQPPIPPSVNRLFKIQSLTCKSLALAMTIISLVLSAVPIEPITFEHIWKCDDSPKNECARLILIPITLSLITLPIIIVTMIMVLLEILDAIVMCVDAAVSALASVAWLVTGFVVIMNLHGSFRVFSSKTPLLVLDEDDDSNREPAGMIPTWIAAGFFAWMAMVCHCLDCAYRLRQYTVVALLKAGKPLPLGFVTSFRESPVAVIPSNRDHAKPKPIKGKQEDTSTTASEPGTL